jgi:ubiquinone/menaquinone biosynthesis C-methylase UbiE
MTRGLWDYIHNDAIAEDYDDYFAHNSLFDFDEPLVLDAIRSGQAGGLVADLGCGTGRALVSLCRNGFRGLAIDLSQSMLEIVQEKADLDELDIQCLRANLVQLDCLSDSSIDHAMCLFSTLGMIRTAAARRLALAHVARTLKPGGRLVLHVHNFWFNLYDHQGIRWVLRSLLWRLWDREFETGDKYFHYRGVSNMFLHVFRRRELKRDLVEAGFQVDQIIPLALARDRAIRAPRLFPSLRANGWVAVCTRP